MTSLLLIIFTVLFKNMKTKLFLFLFLFGLKVFAQKPDSSKSPFNEWQYNIFQNGIKAITPDTIIDNVYDFMPFHRNNISYLGNNGSAAFPLTFFMPDENIPFYFNSWKWYYEEDRYDFYHTRKPYSNIKFVTGTNKEKGEQYLRILHTQNINPKLNLSVKALSHNAIGSYLHQENRSSCFRFSTNYQGIKYKLYAFYELNKFKLNENGGIIHDDYIIDSLYKPDNLNIHLNFAKNVVALRNGFFQQQISIIGKSDSVDSLNKKFKSILEIHHGGSYQWGKKIYSDNVNTGFYINNFLTDSTKTYDSIQSEHITQFANIVLTENNPLKIGILFGALYDQNSYYYYQQNKLFNSLGIHTSVFKINDSTSTGSFTFEKWLSGYWQDNSKLSGIFSYNRYRPKDILSFSIEALYLKKIPDYFQNSWTSNNFFWNKHFNNLEFSESSLSFYEKRYSLGLNFRIATVKNYIYFDTIGYPQQSEHTIRIIKLNLNKNFTLGHFHFNNRLLLQQSSNDSIIRIPSYIGIHSIYYQFFAFKKVLTVQAGAEVYIFSKFYAPKYIPATGQFALQNERKTGEYPFVDVFINLNLKRACIFFKLEHANYMISDANYFLAPHYPVAPRSLKFGVSWNFYD